MPISGVEMTKSEPLESVYGEYAGRFEKCLRMTTYPLAIKMLEKEEDIPVLAKSPLRDIGCHLRILTHFQ